MIRKRFVSLFMSVLLMFSVAVPFTSGYAADYDQKYHPDDWFGYTHSSSEIQQWITDAVKYPKISNDAAKALTGKIKPGDVISFQVEVEMPKGHEEVVQFMEDWKLNMTVPYGANAMIEVYASDVPKITDEEYQLKINEFNNKMDELSELFNDGTLLNDVESGLIPESLYNTHKDMVDNRDKYYDIYLAQLETARTKYGFADSSYGTVENWTGKFEDNPNLSLDEGETYESYINKMMVNNYIEPTMTQVEYEQAVLNFETEYEQIVEEYEEEFEIAKIEYEQGNISESEWQIVLHLMESFEDGTFHETVLQYFKDCRDGYNVYDNISAFSMATLVLSGIDSFHAYCGNYTYNFPDIKVQENESLTYLFDVNIVATDSLFADNYFCLPVLHWRYEENCPEKHWVSEGLSKGHWEYYKTCNARRYSFIKFGNIYTANNFLDFNMNIEDVFRNDKKYLAIQYINDEKYEQKYMNDIYGEIYFKNSLKAIQTITVEYRAENGLLLDREVIELENVTGNDRNYYFLPKNIYDYQLIGPDKFVGTVEEESVTLTFSYERKDAEINIYYVDDAGNNLASSQTITGKTLDEYSSEPIDIVGYELAEMPDNTSGILHEDSADVVYVYVQKENNQ